ncbi:unnamed protein product [Caenorhabditis sp. 36 PRJEB53466]|nr:unnamed protein product [Caenorhabditis sp. 36 PRJEB53466]
MTLPSSPTTARSRLFSGAIASSSRGVEHSHVIRRPDASLWIWIIQHLAGISGTTAERYEELINELRAYDSTIQFGYHDMNSTHHVVMLPDETISSAGKNATDTLPYVPAGERTEEAFERPNIFASLCSVFSPKKENRQARMQEMFQEANVRLQALRGDKWRQQTLQYHRVGIPHMIFRLPATSSATLPPPQEGMSLPTMWTSPTKPQEPIVEKAEHTEKRDQQAVKLMQKDAQEKDPFEILPADDSQIVEAERKMEAFPANRAHQIVEEVDQEKEDVRKKVFSEIDHANGTEIAETKRKMAAFLAGKGLQTVKGDRFSAKPMTSTPIDPQSAKKTPGLSSFIVPASEQKNIPEPSSPLFELIINASVTQNAIGRYAEVLGNTYAIHPVSLRRSMHSNDGSQRWNALLHGFMH